ncbi:MAG: ABC transporter ATP-binding protein, partial [Cyanobacteria bacterium J06648_11]
RITAFPPVYTFLSGMERGELFIFLILTAIGLQFARSAFRFISMLASGYLAARVQVQMTERVFAQVLAFSFPCASRYKVGDLSTYVNTAGGTVKLQITLWNGLIVNSFTVLAYIAVVVSISLPLSGVAILLAVGVALVQRQLQPRIRKTSKRLTARRVDVSKQLIESIQALRVIHTFARQRTTLQHMRHILHKLVPLLQRQTRLMSTLAPVSEVMAVTAIGGLLIAGFFLLDADAQLVLPALITFIAALNRLSVQVQSISSTSNRLADNIGQVDRLNAILSPEDKTFTRHGGRPFIPIRDEIHFDRVSLRYTPDGDNVLDDLSFHMKRGTMTALVGGSGAGKSSLADLLIGLYDPTAGAIRFDGIDMREFDLESWRSHLGVVSQDTFIFNSSILNNIRYGRPDASDEEVIAAAKVARADTFIDKLEEGYNTVLG